MSKLLKQKCSDLQALKFFEECRDEINQIAKSYNKEQHYKKQLAKVHKRLKNVETPSQSKQQKQGKKMLLNNIIVDFLGSFKYNYTYPVFMRECNIISEEVVNKKRLSAALGIEQEYCSHQRFDISILELMIQKIEKGSQKKSQKKEQSVQVELIKRTKQQNNSEILQHKYRQIRQDIERNQKKYYQKQLQIMKTKQIIQLRQEISKQYEQKYNKQKQKVNKKYQQMIDKSKSMNSNSIVTLEQQNIKLLNKNYELSQEVSKMKKSLQQSQIQKSKHSCLKNPEYIQQKNKLINERKQLERKKQEFDCALRGISTKIQDIAQQKIAFQSNKNNTDQYINEAKVQRQNKDYMIQSLYSEMKKMDNRVKLLSQQNIKLRETVKQQSRKIKNQQGSLVQLKQKSLPTSSIINQLNQLRQESVIDIEMTRNIDNYIRNQNIIRNGYEQTIPIKYANGVQVSQDNTKNPLVKKCKQCKNWVTKPKTLTVSTNVTQQDLQPYKQKQKQKIRQEEEINGSFTQSESDFSAKQDMQLEHKNKLAQLKTDMKKIKNKVLLLVNMDNI